MLAEIGEAEGVETRRATPLHGNSPSMTTVTPGAGRACDFKRRSVTISGSRPVAMVGESITPGKDPKVRNDIHPELHRITVTCACGNSFETHSTKSELRLEICSACHPFFTGKQKLVDSAGRVERFQRRYGSRK